MEPWQKELQQSAVSLSQLMEWGFLSSEDLLPLDPMAKQAEIKISPYYASLIDKKNPECPIRLQAIPTLNEQDPLLPEWVQAWSLKIYGRPQPWTPDATGDIQKKVTPRLTHRYEERALLHFSSACTTNCRFCFRKSHLNDPQKSLYEGSYQAALEYLKAHPEIKELILTGGDPLTFPDVFLERFLNSLVCLPSLKVVRFHTRVAVTLPSRITPRLLSLFKENFPFRMTLVHHFNHPRELSPESTQALEGLSKTPLLLLNQSVLLKKVNAQAQVLRNLFVGLYERGVLPYYLHHPDWTPGTFGFRESIEKGRSLFEELRGWVSGPALPDYILDHPEAIGKVSLLSYQVRQLEKRIELVSNRVLEAAVYELQLPKTRQHSGGSKYYLDLSWQS